MEKIMPAFSRSDRERLLNQRSRVIWLCGLSSSGKTTIACSIELELNKQGYITRLLDAENIRSGINNDLGYSDDDRQENIRRVSEISRLFIDCGIICINSFITPTEKIRNLARGITGRENMIEIFVNAPIEVCEKRDVKGLYRQAREGKIKNFTGINSPFEPPPDPDVEIRTDKLSIAQSIEKCLDYILPAISLNQK